MLPPRLDGDDDDGPHESVYGLVVLRASQGRKEQRRAGYRAGVAEAKAGET